MVMVLGALVLGEVGGVERMAVRVWMWRVRRVWVRVRAEDGVGAGGAEESRGAIYTAPRAARASAWASCARCRIKPPESQ